MSTWCSKHVEENIWRINNIKCITLVFCMVNSWCTVRETLSYLWLVQFCCMHLKYEIITHPCLKIQVNYELLESWLKINSSGFSLVIDMTNYQALCTICTCHSLCNQGYVLSKSSLYCNMSTIHGNFKKLSIKQCLELWTLYGERKIKDAKVK